MCVCLGERERERKSQHKQGTVRSLSKRVSTRGLEEWYIPMVFCPWKYERIVGE